MPISPIPPKTLIFWVGLNIDITYTDVGTGYLVWFASLPYIPSMKARLIIARRWGSEMGLKGMRLRNNTDGVTLCEVTWSGSSDEWGYCSDVIIFPVAGKRLDIEVKGSSATEEVTIRNLMLLMVGD